MVLHTHGGGWILGDEDTHECLYRELANAARAADRSSPHRHCSIPSPTPTSTPRRIASTIHDFVLVNPIAETPAVRAAIAQAADELQTALTT